jgi:hypothetical protein
MNGIAGWKIARFCSGGLYPGSWVDGFQGLTNPDINKVLGFVRTSP